MTEAAALEDAHLEETEVLAVLGGRPQTRLAPGDAQGLPAVGAEHVADRLAWTGLADRLERAGRMLALESRLQARDTRCPFPQARTVQLQLAAGLWPDGGVGEEPPVLLEEADHLPVLLERLHVARERLRGRLRLRCGARGDDHQGAQTQYQGFQTMTS